MGQRSPLLLRAQGEDLFPSSDTLSPWGNAELHAPSLSPCSNEAISEARAAAPKSGSATGEDPMCLGAHPLRWMKWALSI